MIAVAEKAVDSADRQVLAEKGSQILSWSEKQMRDHPVTALLAAASIGLILGWVVKWRQ